MAEVVINRAAQIRPSSTRPLDRYFSGFWYINFLRLICPPKLWVIRERRRKHPAALLGAIATHLRAFAEQSILVQPPVGTADRQQLVVSPSFDDFALVKYQDLVRMANRR